MRFFDRIFRKKRQLDTSNDPMRILFTGPNILQELQHMLRACDHAKVMVDELSQATKKTGNSAFASSRVPMIQKELTTFANWGDQLARIRSDLKRIAQPEFWEFENRESVMLERHNEAIRVMEKVQRTIESIRGHKSEIVEQDLSLNSMVFVPLDDLEGTAGLLKKCFNDLLRAYSTMAEGAAEQDESK